LRQSSCSRVGVYVSAASTWHGAAISACETGQQRQQALYLLRATQRPAIEQVVVTCRAAVGACEAGASRVSRPDTSYERGSVLVPGVFTDCAAVSVCERGLQRQQASYLLRATLHQATVQQGLRAVHPSVRANRGQQRQQAWHLLRALQHHLPGCGYALRGRQRVRKGPAAPAGLLPLASAAGPGHLAGGGCVPGRRQCIRKGTAASAGLTFLTSVAAPSCRM